MVRVVSLALAFLFAFIAAYNFLRYAWLRLPSRFEARLGDTRFSRPAGLVEAVRRELGLADATARGGRRLEDLVLTAQLASGSVARLALYLDQAGETCARVTVAVP